MKESIKNVPVEEINGITMEKNFSEYLNKMEMLMSIESGDYMAATEIGPDKQLWHVDFDGMGGKVYRKIYRIKEFPFYESKQKGAI